MINIETIEVSGFKGALKGMRNAWESWAKSDSYACDRAMCCDCTARTCIPFHIGPEDMKLCKKLIKSGTDHRKFLRMIHVQADITAPLYWWKQADTYKIGTTTNSTSTMHIITKKEFTLNDFSVDELPEVGVELFDALVKNLNQLREGYLSTKAKVFWDTIIKVLPSSYNQLRTIDVDYETLIRMHHARKNHKLSEWHQFCDWIETLPYMKEFLSE